LVGKPERKQRGKWLDNNKMDHREIGWGGTGWIHLAQDRDQWMALVNTVMNFPVPYNVEKFLNSCTTGGFSRRMPSRHRFSWFSSVSERTLRWFPSCYCTLLVQLSQFEFITVMLHCSQSHLNYFFFPKLYAGPNS
jgi:hypothetical protein